MSHQIKNLPPSAKAALAVMLLWAVYVGGTKPEQPAANRISQLVLALSGGGMVDPSGVLGRAVQLAAVQSFNEETEAIISNANAVVAAAMEDYAALTNELAQRDYSVAYLAYDFPRAFPPYTTNHNITATIERVSTGCTNCLSAWVYFSAEPATNVTLHLEASLAEGLWVELTVVTNTWPGTEAVNGLACYRYDFEVPAGMVGVPLKPHYDILFGGPLPGQYLRVPDTGVIVSTNGVDCAPFTGWDDAYPEPFGDLAIRYVGGIAVQATAAGTNYTGMAGEVTL